MNYLGAKNKDFDFAKVENLLEKLEKFPSDDFNTTEHLNVLSKWASSSAF